MKGIEMVTRNPLLAKLPKNDPRAHRQQACHSSKDPILDWQGHLPVSGYYPCAGRDWAPILANVTDTWVYVDHAPLGNRDARAGIIEWLSHPPDGLTLELMVKDVPPHLLSSWAPWPFVSNSSVIETKQIEQAPVQFAILAIYKTDSGKRIRLMYVIGEATAALISIYGRLPFTPMILALIQMGYGSAGGWNRFFDPNDMECYMRHFFRWHPSGISPLILSNNYLPPKEFESIKQIPIDPDDPSDYLDLRITTHNYKPNHPDTGMLTELFPAFSDCDAAWRLLQKMHG